MCSGLFSAPQASDDQWSYFEQKDDFGIRVFATAELLPRRRQGGRAEGSFVSICTLFRASDETFRFGSNYDELTTRRNWIALQQFKMAIGRP